MMPILKAIQSEKTRLFFFCGYAVLIPLSQKISTLFILIWVSHSLFTIDKFFFQKNRLLYILPILYFLIVFSLIYSSNKDFSFIEKRASLIAFPLLFFLNGHILLKKEAILKVVHSFVYGCIVAVFYCEVLSVYNAYTTDLITVYLPKSLHSFSDFYAFLKCAGFTSVEFSVIHQTVYFSIYIISSIIFLLTFPFKRKIITYLTIFIFSITIYQIANRAAILSLSALIFLVSIKQVKKRTHKIIVALFLFLLISSLSLFIPRFNKTYTDLINLKKTPDLNNSVYLRIHSWNTSIAIIKDHWLFGVGLGDEENTMRDYYKKKKYSRAYWNNLNSHNTYFTIWIQAGLLALFTLLYALYTLFKLHLKNKNLSLIYLSFFAIFSLNFLFESMLTRYSGISFFCFVFCFLISLRNFKLSNS